MSSGSQQGGRTAKDRAEGGQDDDALWRLPAVDQVKLVRSRQVSARELLEIHLDRIAEVNPLLNAVVSLDAEVAQARAARIDEALAHNEKLGPLTGLVTAHKDLFDTADFPTTYGSPPYARHRPTVDAPLVSRVRAAGAVAVGKTNTPEFGAGSHTFNPVHGTTLNPFDPALTAGGSSGGAAVALRAGMVSIADGSDFGGSLRNPAAWNNVVGFRPSPRVVPGGALGNAWNPMPITGPMARSVDDLVLLLRVLAVRDLADPLGRAIDLPPMLTPPSRPPRVAWSSDLGGLPIEPELVEVLDRFRADLEILGWDAEDDEPDLAGADECFVTLRASMFAERADTLADVIDQIKPTVRDEMERGRKLTGPEVTGAYAQLNVLWKRAVDFFDRYDVLLAPVTQVSPFSVDVEYPTEVAGVEMGSYIEWMRVCCRVTSLGCPAMSLPAGFTPSGMPVGIQIIGRPFGDVDLLKVAKALEATTGHGKRWPPARDGSESSSVGSS